MVAVIVVENDAGRAGRRAAGWLGKRKTKKSQHFYISFCFNIKKGAISLACVIFETNEALYTLYGFFFFHSLVVIP